MQTAAKLLLTKIFLLSMPAFSAPQPLQCTGFRLIDGLQAGRVQLKQSTFDRDFLDGDLGPITFIVDRYFMGHRSIGMTIYDTQSDRSSSGIFGLYRIPETDLDTANLNLYQFEADGTPVQFQLNCHQKMK